MKTTLIAIALVAALAQPAAALTFPSLTTIYVGSGVYDSGDGTNAGIATSIHCSNVSGVLVQVRALILSNTSVVAGAQTVNLGHGDTRTFSTHLTLIFSESAGPITTGTVTQGVVNVEATNSAVFCTADRVDAAGNPPVFMSRSTSCASIPTPARWSS